MSSTVRRCVEKSSGKEFAVKILDVSTERCSEEQAQEIRNAALSEIKVLRLLSGHSNISEKFFFFFGKKLLKMFHFSVQLHDFYEASAFLFIVFELYEIEFIGNSV